MGWVSAIRLVSQTRLSKNVQQFIQLRSIVVGVTAAAPFSSSSSSCCSDCDSGGSSDYDDERSRQISSVLKRNNLDCKVAAAEPLALQVFTQLNKEDEEEEEEGLFKFPDMATYASMIRIFCYWGMHKRLESLLLEIFNSEKENLGFDPLGLFEEFVSSLQDEPVSYLLLDRALRATVKAYVSVGMLEEACDALYLPIKWDFRITLPPCNLLLDLLIERGELQMALESFLSLEEKTGLAPDAYTYGILIKAFSEKGILEEASDVFEMMKKAGVTPDKFTLTSYLRALCSQGKSSEAYRALREKYAATSDIVDARTFKDVLIGFIKERQLDEAVNLLSDMEEHGFIPDEFCYGSLIYAYFEAGDKARALDFYNDMKDKNITVTKPAVMGTVILCLCEEGRFAEAVDLFKSFPELSCLGSLGKFLYSVVIHALCKLGRSEEGLRMLEEMRDKKMAPDEITYTTLVSGCFFDGRVSDAYELLKKMEKKGMKPINDANNVLANLRNGLMMVFRGKMCRWVYEEGNADDALPEMD